MQFPALHDTILALSSAPVPAPLGLLRISGPDTFALAASLCLTPPEFITGRAAVSRGYLRWTGQNLPALLTWFRGPHSYTGQDLLEISTVGNLPLLHDFCAQLVRNGARRAQPGEFTARAFLNGRLDAEQVDSIASRIHTADNSSAQRTLRGPDRARAGLESARDRILNLLSRIEAGIDFTDEEDVSFITPPQAHAEIAAIAELLATIPGVPGGALNPALPHIALLGLPNAGKSSLFNCLLASERALISQQAGTTRDVIRAECMLAGVRCVLMDSAGLDDPLTDLAQAAANASARTAAQAELILWVHDRSQAWSGDELHRLMQLDPAHVLVVMTKADLPAHAAANPEIDACLVCARTNDGIAALCNRLRTRLSDLHPTGNLDGTLEARNCLGRALDLICHEKGPMQNADLVAFELKIAHNFLETSGSQPVAEQVLDRIFRQFCIGK